MDIEEYVGMQDLYIMPKQVDNPASVLEFIADTLSRVSRCTLEGWYVMLSTESLNDIVEYVSKRLLPYSIKQVASLEHFRYNDRIIFAVRFNRLEEKVLWLLKNS